MGGKSFWSNYRSSSGKTRDTRFGPKSFISSLHISFLFSFSLAVRLNRASLGRDGKALLFCPVQQKEKQPAIEGCFVVTVHADRIGNRWCSRFLRRREYTKRLYAMVTVAGRKGKRYDMFNPEER